MSWHIERTVSCDHPLAGHHTEKVLEIGHTRVAASLVGGAPSSGTIDDALRRQHHVGHARRPIGRQIVDNLAAKSMEMAELTLTNEKNTKQTSLEILSKNVLDMHK